MFSMKHSYGDKNPLKKTACTSTPSAPRFIPFALWRMSFGVEEVDAGASPGGRESRPIMP